jgi:hypothetical protein
LITTAAFIGLYVIVWAVLAHVSVADIWWIDVLVDVVGGFLSSSSPGYCFQPWPPWCLACLSSRSLPPSRRNTIRFFLPPSPCPFGKALQLHSSLPA